MDLQDTYEKSRGQNQVFSDLTGVTEQTQNSSWVQRTYDTAGKQNRRNSYQNGAQTPKIFNTFFSSTASGKNFL